MGVSRRNLILGGTATILGGALLRPADKGAGHNAYFESLNTTLRSQGIDKPSLVIDLDRLDRNIDRTVASIKSGSPKHYRVVTKSIPSPDLVDYVSKRAKTDKQMVFHRPFIEAMTHNMPSSNLLLGKPMPISAVQTFYRQHTGRFEPEHQLQWLIDTPQRLAQYLKFAQHAGLKIAVNLELDVGLHRGGFTADHNLAEALTLIAKNPQHVSFSGFMGYDAHLAGIPSFLAKRELPKVKERYANAVNTLKQVQPALYREDLCFNGAGSPTFRYYKGNELLNDLSAGSCLMKPTHFDLPILEDFEASCFIATPVLKKLKGSHIPALEWTGPLLRAWDVNKRQTLFIYGGNWLSEPESPPGLTPHFAYASSNQEGYNASNSVQVDVDDFVFMRPTQSESVLLQFDDLLAVRNGKIQHRWPVLTKAYSDGQRA